jgi:hypothetical protein
MLSLFNNERFIKEGCFRENMPAKHSTLDEMIQSPDRQTYLLGGCQKLILD